ncbi:MAG: sensor histidine kinase, partial [Candidatus Sericytochromatia bacterium]
MDTEHSPESVQQLIAERDRAIAERDLAREELRRAQLRWGYITREVEDTQQRLEATNQGLDARNRDLQELDRLKMKFYANMSHELRTPLNSIIGFTEDALDGLAGELNPEQQRYLNNILGSSQHLLKVITEILDLARLRSGKQLMNPVDFPIKRAFYEIDSMMNPLLLRKGQALIVEDVRALPMVHADSERVLQILLNLVSNAHKYANREGHVHLRARVEGEMMRVEVQDDGVGIPKEDLPLLFEEFTDVAKKGKWHEQGTGLGLTITKSLVEAQGGTIAVESEPGRGSVFSFT